MMTTLTREQLEATRNILLDRMVPEWCVDDEHAAFWRNRVKAAFALALRGLDTVPRPIEEAPKDGSVIYAFHRSAKRFVPCMWEIQPYHNVPRSATFIASTALQIIIAAVLAVSHP